MNLVAFIILVIFSLIAICVMVFDIKTGRISTNPRYARTIALMFYIMLTLWLLKTNLELFAKL